MSCALHRLSKTRRNRSRGGQKRKPRRTNQYDAPLFQKSAKQPRIHHAVKKPTLHMTSCPVCRWTGVRMRAMGTGKPAAQGQNRETNRSKQHPFLNASIQTLCIIVAQRTDRDNDQSQNCNKKATSWMECVEFVSWCRFYYRVCPFRECLHRLHLISGCFPKFPLRMFAHTFAAHVHDISPLFAFF